jgi:hypothetical protein
MLTLASIATSTLACESSHGALMLWDGEVVMSAPGSRELANEPE